MLFSSATAPSMGNLPHSLVSSVVWGSEETPFLMFFWFLPERNSTSRRFLQWRCRSRLLPSLPSICRRKTDSVLTRKKEGDVNVSNRHLQRCVWRNSWQTLPELVTLRLKRKVSISHMQMTYISTSDSQKAPTSSIHETQSCHPRWRTQASLLDLPGKSPRIQRVKLAPPKCILSFSLATHLIWKGVVSLPWRFSSAREVSALIGRRLIASERDETLLPWFTLPVPAWGKIHPSPNLH